MERRFYLGVGLLVLMLAVGLLGAWGTRKAQLPAAQLLEQAAQASLEGDLDSGIALAEQAEASWKKHWRWVAAVADHSPMDDIDGLFAEMGVYAREKEAGHFAACCRQLASLLQAVSDAHALTWWNIL